MCVNFHPVAFLLSIFYPYFSLYYSLITGNKSSPLSDVSIPESRPSFPPNPPVSRENPQAMQHSGQQQTQQRQGGVDHVLTAASEASRLIARNGYGAEYSPQYPTESNRYELHLIMVLLWQRWICTDWSNALGVLELCLTCILCWWPYIHVQDWDSENKEGLVSWIWIDAINHLINIIHNKYVAMTNYFPMSHLLNIAILFPFFPHHFS